MRRYNRRAVMAALYNLGAIRRGLYADPKIYANDVIVELEGSPVKGLQPRNQWVRVGSPVTGGEEFSIRFASLTFFPMMLGIVVSRPWMAMRIAVIALRNAADVRIKISNAVWPSDSSRSRRGDMSKIQDDTDSATLPCIRRVRVKGWLLQLLFRRS